MALDTILKTGYSLGKMLKGAIDAKKAKGMGAPLVDPNQQAMMNATKRMLRANQTGTSSFMDRRMNASDRKMMFRRSTMAGARSLSPYLQMMRDADANIRESVSNERLGLLGSLATQTQNIADRKMDLLEQAKQQKNLEAQANKQTGEKNLFAVGSSLGDSNSGDSNLGSGDAKALMELLKKLKGANIDSGATENATGGANG